MPRPPHDSTLAKGDHVALTVRVRSAAARSDAPACGVDTAYDPNEFPAGVAMTVLHAGVSRCFCRAADGRVGWFKTDLLRPWLVPPMRRVLKPG